MSIYLWSVIPLIACGCATTEPDAAPGSDPAPTAAASDSRDALHRHFAPAVGWSDAGELVSEIVTDGEGFDEVLPSWNVAAPHAFQVDVRVGRGDEWSPWLRIGDWNVPERAGDEVTTFEGGKVAVDVLELEEAWETTQLRFTSAGGAALDPEVVRARVVLTDTAGLDAAIERTRQESWPSPVTLDVPPRSQRVENDDISHRICSPTSVAMVTDFHGPSVPTRRVAERLFDPHFDLYGNWNRAVQGAYSFGVPGELVRISSWDHAREYLNAGRPIIASIRAKEGQLEGAPYAKTAGHLLVVTGLGPDGDVRVNDPAAAEVGTVRRVYRRADMETVWFANGGVSYVLGRDSRGGVASR